MKRLGSKLMHAAAVAGLLAGLVATPALAKDHHKHHRDDDDWHHRNSWHNDSYRSHHYYRDYDRSYYYSEPRSYYYSEPRVYVPVPPPPSFGLNLVFPFH